MFCFLKKAFLNRFPFTILVLVLAGGCGLFLIGCRSSRADGKQPPAVPRFYLEARGGGRSPKAIELPTSGTVIQVDPLPVLIESDMQTVQLVRVELGLCAMFTFKGSAARSLYLMTVQNRGQRLVLFVNGVPTGVRVIDQVISDGVLLTFLEVPDEKLPELVTRMQGVLRENTK